MLHRLTSKRQEIQCQKHLTHKVSTHKD